MVIEWSGLRPRLLARLDRSASKLAYLPGRRSGETPWATGGRAPLAFKGAPAASFPCRAAGLETVLDAGPDRRGGPLSGRVPRARYKDY